MCLQLFLIFTCDGQTDTLTATQTVLTVVTERFVCNEFKQRVLASIWGSPCPVAPGTWMTEALIRQMRR